MNARIPEGYRQNANGDLVLIQNIKEVDLLRDELVLSIAERALAKSGELGAFRTQVFEEIEAFVQESASRFKAKMGGQKGNLTLFSFDGRFKVVVANQDNLTFDERLPDAHWRQHGFLRRRSGGHIHFLSLCRGHGRSQGLVVAWGRRLLWNHARHGCLPKDRRSVALRERCLL